MEQFVKLVRAKWRTAVVLLLPAVLAPLLATGAKEAKAAYVIIIMAIFWMTEALPLPVTSLLPVVLFPLLGLMSTNDVCIAYMKETNVTFIGGLIIALSIEYSQLHQRIALKVLMLVGTQPRWLMFGFMLTTMVLSMWISNTAATAMMVPIVEAVVHELYKEEKISQEEISIEPGSTAVSIASLVPTSIPEVDLSLAENIKSNGAVKEVNADGASGEFNNESSEKGKKISSGILLSVAYASNVGGTGSLIGSGPQLTLKGIVNDLFGPASGLNFATWMAFNVPGMLINTFIAWIWLQFQFIGFKNDASHTKQKEQTVRSVLRRKYSELGPMTFHEFAVLILFLLCVALWFFRDPQFIPGWAELVSSTHVDDATAVLAVAMLLFVIPSRPNLPSFVPFARGNESKGTSATLLDWKYAEARLPWGIVLLLGGGFALSDGAKVSGLSKWLGLQMAGLTFMPPFAIMFVVCILTATVTEVASNTATANILLPILAQMAVNIGVNPLFLMIPATVTCSYAFMLPVATPPNAIVFSATRMNPIEMMKAGFVMNIVCVIVICCLVASLGNVFFEFNTFPIWASALIGTTEKSNSSHVH